MTSKIITLILLVGILIAGFFVIRDLNSGDNQVEEINQRNINIQPTQGVIAEVSEERVEYKDSILIKLENDPTNIYITNESEVKDSTGTSLDRTELKEGMQVAVIGEPTEGGLEAREVVLIRE